LIDNLALFVTVTNLTDEVYNVGFAPAGARPRCAADADGGLKVRF